MAYGILIPRPGMEPVSPALEGGFLTTGSPVRAVLMSVWDETHIGVA